MQFFMQIFTQNREKEKEREREGRILYIFPRHERFISIADGSKMAPLFNSICSSAEKRRVHLNTSISIHQEKFYV